MQWTETDRQRLATSVRHTIRKTWTFKFKPIDESNAYEVSRRLGWWPHLTSPPPTKNEKNAAY